MGSPGLPPFGHRGPFPNLHEEYFEKVLRLGYLPPQSTEGVWSPQGCETLPVTAVRPSGSIRMPSHPAKKDFEKVALLK